MNYDYNKNRETNLDVVNILITQEGYVDLGWANSGKEFSNSNTPKRGLDCSIYSYRSSHVVYIDDIRKEILHVDMSD